MYVLTRNSIFLFFFFNDTATTEIYTLSLHDALPISLRNGKLVFLALLANFVLMPLGALAIATLLRLDQPLGIALLLLGAAAGAPFLPKLAGIAKGNLALDRKSVV